MSAILFYILLVIVTLCLPVAYAMGQITGSEAMRDSLIHHPSTRSRDMLNQISDVA